ncbi:MAG TPA: hypothetical protein VLB47_03635, partial [Solirubrobacteraceae bacterium]|nr:hypothetical protein [Solirubrobacteraceae bacterium]
DAPAGAAHPGAAVTLGGRAPKGVADVTLEERAADGTWSAAAHAVPDAGGTFSAAIAPAGPVVVRARSGDLLSREVHVSTAPEVSARAVRRGRLIVVRVRPTPPQPGARIRLDHYNRERFDWRPSLTARLDARSRATLVLRSAAWQRLRVVVTRGVFGYGPGASRAVRVAPLRPR